jgi:hypothetical protein
MVAVKYLRLPDPKVVEAFRRKPLFPSARQGGQRGSRDNYWETENRKVVLDDNATADWALFWSHGYRGKSKGWSLAHVWERAYDPECFSNIANLCIIKQSLAAFTDKDGPLVEHLRFHAQEIYGWRPGNENKLEKPAGYDELSWKYLTPEGDPIDNVNTAFEKSKRKRAMLLKALPNSMTHWRYA